MSEWDMKICCMGAGYVGGTSMVVMAGECPKVRKKGGTDEHRDRRQSKGSCRSRNLNCCCCFCCFVTKIQITVVDSSQDKINAWNGDELPIYEPGLKEIVQKCRDKNLYFSTDANKAIAEADMIFIAVNAPTKEGGQGAGRAQDIINCENSARTIAQVATSSKIVVEKGTFPVRTAEAIARVLEYNSNGIKHYVLSNPEFLAQG